MSDKKAPLGKVTPELRNQLTTKPGDKFFFKGKPIDLREIDDATAIALAEDPVCMFLAWKDENKRPDGQRGLFAKKSAASQPPAAKPQATPPGGKP